MQVKTKACYVVKPAKPTWNGVLQLSELDQISAIPYVSSIYFYKYKTTNKNWLNPTNKIINTIRNSLSHALISYFPLAGRLRWKVETSRLELECNAMGVELIEAESSKNLSDFGDFLSCKTFEDLVPHVDYEKPLHDLPLFMVKLTRFECGGLGLGTLISHAVTDGIGAYHFIKDWAKLARDEPLVEVTPCVDRRVLLDEGVGDSLEEVDDFSNLPTLIGKVNDLEERRKETSVVTLVLTKNEVLRLKNCANRERVVYDDKVHMFSRFEVVASHIWRCACKARELSFDQMTTLCFCVNARNRMDPPLPPRFFGNAIVDVIVTSKAGEIISSPITHGCQRIREAKEKVTNNYVKSLIEFLKTQRNVCKYHDQATCGSLEGVFYGNPNLVVASWLNLPVHGLDFGWGNEVYMGPGPQDHFDGDVTLLPGSNDDGSMVVVLGLQTTHMVNFKKFFYDDIGV